MRQGWTNTKVGNILSLEYGKPLPEIKRQSSGDYPVYGANGEIDRTDQYYYNKKTIIIGRKGSAGELNLTAQKFWPLDVTYFVKFDDNKYDLKFIYFLLKQLNLPSLAKGVKPGINRNEVYGIDIKVPNLIEQQRIVAILDQAFAAIDQAKANTEKNLQNVRGLFDLILDNTFSNSNREWEEKRVGQVCKVIAGQSPEGKFYNNSEVGLPFYQGKKEFTTKYLGKPTTWTSSITKVAERNDILMSVRAPVGPVNFATEQICIGRGLAAIRSTKLMEPEFVFRFLQYNEKYIVGNAGAVFSSINKAQSEDIVIPVPTIEEQRLVVSKFEILMSEVQKLKSSYQRKLVELDVLKKSILQKAFNGEL
mgnify:CR=1 FL=1